MVKVTADIKKNRLYIKPVGRISKADLENMYTDVRFCIADLQPDFCLFADYSECKFGDIAAIPVFRKVIAYLISQGLGEVVRILPNKSIFLRQIFNFTTRFQGYRPICVDSLKEAEEVISSSAKRHRLRFHLLDEPVGYSFDKNNYTGKIFNISTGGCMILSHEVIPPVNAVVVVRISFAGKNSTVTAFELQTCVVRVSENGFAVKFDEITDSSEKELLDCIVEKLQAE